MTADLKIDSTTGKRGQIIVRAEAISESNHTVVYQMSATDLENLQGGCLGMCGSPAAIHYEVMREVGTNSGHFATTYKSPKAHGTSSPLWPSHKMRLSKFAGGSPSSRVKIRFCTGQEKEIGYFITTPEELTHKRIHPIKKGKSGNSGIGQAELKSFDLIEVPSFVDYLRGGWQISLAIAIDFTASNGNPASPASLHHVGP